MSTRISPSIALCVSLVMSTCVSDTEGDVRQVCSCASATGCDPNQLCDPDNNCDKVNVAYGKPAQISSRRPAISAEGKELTTPPCAAVNGRTGHVVNGENGSYCVHSALGDRQAWWRVNLGQSYTVTDLTIYSREKLTGRLAGIWVYVDGKICTKLPDETEHYPLVATIPCDKPLRGQVVTLAKNGTTITHNQFIDFCELQIWVCRSGRFGWDCSQTCHCHNSVTCDNHYGTCHNERVEDGGAVSLAGPVTGAVVGGFCLGVVSLLTLWMCRRRAKKNKPCATFDDHQGPEHEVAAPTSISIAASNDVTTTNDVTATNDVTTTNGVTTTTVAELESGEYASLHETSDYLSLYNTPVIVYDNTVI